ncbi:MAG TPA: hypothetical protein VNV85_14440 [Puia sp.]|jgi:hypothetical protein|nr:hypothetical protein [Puia sp.]
MKKIIIFFLVCMIASVSSEAQVPLLSVITTLVKKVLNALDLEVEKLQNQTVWLQNAQKELENAMAQLQLDAITGWLQKQKDLYQQYYQELSLVKQIITDYDKVKAVIQLQSRIVSEYKSAYGLFQQDKNFSAKEITYIYDVYSGILEESKKNLDQALLVVNDFVTQMSDGARMNILDNAAKGMQKNYNDLKQFNNQNIQLSLQRAAANNDLQTVKNLYGLP